MREQKHHVDRASGDKSGDQHGVHRGLQNRPRSMTETRVKSPKVCFSADSYLVYGIRRDSRRRFSVMAESLRSSRRRPHRQRQVDRAALPVDFFGEPGWAAESSESTAIATVA
jgi:hypothetical protein